MHNRIFLIGNKTEDFHNDINVREAAYKIGADFVVESENFEGDIRWFCDYLGIPYEMQKFQGKNIAKIRKMDFVEGIQRDRKRIAEEIKNSLKEHPDDIDRVKYIINRKGFIVHVPEYGFVPVEYLSSDSLKSDDLYIYRTYFYHC